MRGTGWRVSQVLALEWRDVDLEAGTLRLRGDLGKTSAERLGRTVPLARWLRDELAEWDHPIARVVGAVREYRQVIRMVGKLWALSGAPAEVWRQRPDHAFRIGLVSELARARVDREAVEHYVGHVIVGVRAHYVDPSRLPLDEVAAAIPPVSPRVRLVSTPEAAPAPVPLRRPR
jgi:integrase